MIRVPVLPAFQRPATLTRLSAGRRSGYEARSRVISEVMRGLSGYKFGHEAPELIPT